MPEVEQQVSNTALSKLHHHFTQMKQVVRLQCPSEWNELKKRVMFLDERNARRLRAAVGSKVGWVIIEDQYIDRDYRDTFSHVFSRRFATPPSRCQRLHFFSRDITTQDSFRTLEASVLQPNYLGYAVIRPTRPNGLGRMLVSPKMALSDLDGVEVSLCEESVTLFGSKLTVRGFPFIGQDVDVTTCAQATLWMLRRYYSNRYRQYAETRPYELSKLLAHHLHGDRSFPATGLSDWQMAEMLRGLGFSPMIYAKSEFPEFHQLLLSYLESGVPLVLSFGRPEDKAGHAVACFGFRHRSLVQPSQSMGPLVYESNCLLVNDDNYPPYLEVGQGDAPDEYPMAPSFGYITSMVVPLPERINLLAEQFKALALELITKTGSWSIAAKSPLLGRLLEERKLVLRFYLTTCRNLKQRIVDQKMPDKIVEFAYQHMPLPHFVWICEFHDKARDWDECCLGEIVWDATCNKDERQGLLALHYPESLVINMAPVFENRVEPNHESWNEIPLQISISPSYSPASANLDKF